MGAVSPARVCQGAMVRYGARRPFARFVTGRPDDGLSPIEEWGPSAGRGSGDADRCNHRRNRDQIGRDIALDLLGNIHRLAFAAEPGQDFDKSAQEAVPGDEQKVEEQRWDKVLYCQQG